jgi:hypothetical protein
VILIGTDGMVTTRYATIDKYTRLSSSCMSKAENDTSSKIFLDPNDSFSWLKDEKKTHSALLPFNKLCYWGVERPRSSSFLLEFRRSFDRDVAFVGLSGYSARRLMDASGGLYINPFPSTLDDG